MERLNDRFKLTLSLLFNGISKLPAVLLVTSVLPQISDSLGFASYNSFLAALAFGSFFVLPFAGINAVVRRIVGTRFGCHDEEGQADAFVSAIAVTSGVVATACSLVLILSLTVFSNRISHTAAIVALFPIISAGLNLFDNIRAAFNEHYVTAALLFAFQLIVYLLVIVLHPGISGMIVAALIMVAPGVLTSTSQASLLVVRRTYLLRGTLKKVPEILRGSFVFSIGEGSLSGAINASVFFLSSYGSASEGAWYGTFVRVFQSVLSPLLLFMFPLSAFVATKWPRLSANKRLRLIRLALIFGLFYGGVGALALAIGSQRFLQHFYHIAPIASSLQVAAISVFFMGIMSDRAYGMVIYSIDNGRFLSVGTFVAILLATVLAASGGAWSTPLHTLCTFSVIGGICLLAVTCADALKRRDRGIQEPPR
jgi:O-antigen/teichoic acid export membrane protein